MYQKELIKISVTKEVACLSPQRSMHSTNHHVTIASILISDIQYMYQQGSSEREYLHMYVIFRQLGVSITTYIVLHQ